jgi:hypothetical protein
MLDAGCEVGEVFSEAYVAHHWNLESATVL